MYDKELLYFNHVTGEWDYDLYEISTTFHAENVASLMMETLTNLSPSLRHILVSASCIGAQFSVRLLASAMDRPEAEVLSNLLACSYVAYIFQIDSETFKFSHDNIHSAAYSMLEEADRKRLHLKIGRIMKSMWSTRDQQEEHIFDVVGQLNKGLALLDPSPELLDLVNLNHQAGLKSKGSTAYDNAKGFIETGLALLKVN
jgi:predicted ATPase